MRFLIFLSLLLINSQASSSELSILAEAPNKDLKFVNKILKDHVVVDENTQDKFTTKWFSIIKNTKVKSVSLIEADTDKLTYESIRPMLKEASSFAPVVLSTVTPLDGFLCLQMKKETETVFVLPIGERSLDLNREGVKWCQAPNLIFVGGLQNINQKLPKSDFGNKYVRVAAQGKNVKVINKKGRNTVWTSSQAATAFVATEVALYAKKFPNLKGYKLAHSFLKARTKKNRRLTHFIKEGRVL